MSMFSPWLALPCALWLANAEPLVAQGPVTKTYDLRGLLAPEFPWRAGVRMMPGEDPGETPRTGARSEVPTGALGQEDVLAILAQAVGPAENGAAAPLLQVTNDLLVVTATEEAHQRIATWVELCRQIYLEQVTFEVHLLPATTLSGASGRLQRDEADRLLRAAGPHPTYTSTTRVGSSTLLRSDQDSCFVRDYDVEVAQKSVSFDPKLDVLLTGRAWQITTSRCVDGRLLVSVVGQYAEEAEPPRLLQLPHRDLRAKQQTTPVHLPILRYHQENAVARLADGEALLFGGDDSHGSACCVRMRRPQTVAAPSGGGWAWLATGDCAGPRQPAACAHLCLKAPGDDRPLLAQAPAEAPSPLLLDAAALLEVVSSGPLSQDAGDFVGPLPGGWLLVRADETRCKAALDLLRGMTSSLVRDLTVEVRYGRLATPDATLAGDGRLDPAELSAKLPGTYLASALLTDNFHRLAFVQHAYVRDYEVEIAQEAAVPNPVIGSANAGITIAGRVMPAARDQFRLFLEVSFTELVGKIVTFDLEDEDLGPVELVTMRDVTFEVSPIVEARRWALMYLAPLHGTDEHFAVVARVRE